MSLGEPLSVKEVLAEFNHKTVDLLDQIDSLKKELTATRKERDDWRWGYQLTEGILKSDRKWHGVNERFSNGQIIEAAKLAKDLMGKRRYNSKTEPIAVPDYYGDLINWIAAGLHRSVEQMNHQWKIKDIALSRQMLGFSIYDMLKTEDWIRFKKGL